MVRLLSSPPPEKSDFYDGKRNGILISLLGLVLFLAPMMLFNFYKDDNWLIVVVFIAFTGLLLTSLGISKYAKNVVNLRQFEERKMENVRKISKIWQLKARNRQKQEEINRLQRFGFDTFKYRNKSEKTQ